jgi:hypothetical protein
MRVVFLIILFVPLQFVRAQTLITLAPQSSCNNGVYVDYVAKVKVIQNKKELRIAGQLFTNTDSIKHITVIANKGLQTINGRKEKLKAFIKKITIDKIENQYLIYTDSIIQQKIQTIINSKELQIDFDLSQIPMATNIEFELFCCFEFKNGCKYIKRQKIFCNY